MTAEQLSAAQQTQLENRDPAGQFKTKEHADVDDSAAVLGLDDEQSPEPEAANYRFPDAVQVLPVDASREEWLAQRRTGVGGSDASSLVGANRYKDILDVYEDKKGLSQPIESNYRMRRGLAMEPGMRDEFTRQTGIDTQRRGLLRNKERPHTMVSVDSIVAAGVGITLTRSHRVIFAEQSYTPGENAQAMHRLDRAGQTELVEVTYLVAADTVDEQVQNVLATKIEDLDSLGAGDEAGTAIADETITMSTVIESVVHAAHKEAKRRVRKAAKAAA